MDDNNSISLHNQVKKQIVQACIELGFQAQEEFRGIGWRADVFTIVDNIKYAIEVQTTRQTLLRTLERQEKYKKEGIIGCWLFEKEPARQEGEREDLPLFKINLVDDQIYISLKQRKTIPLNTFVSDFLQNKIKFCHTLKPIPVLDIVFLEMPCWKCGAENHVYYIAPLRSSCNTEILHNEAMWVSDKLIFHPEITKEIKKYFKSEKGKHLKIGEIKERYSKTVGDSYLSFGCAECDSIFGDWFIHEAIMETCYHGGLDKISVEVKFDLDLKQNIPHWCHPGDNEFCVT